MDGPPTGPKQGPRPFSCKGCGEVIRMLALEGSRPPKLAPITVKRYVKGNIAIPEAGVYRVLKEGEDWDGPRYLNHFADCRAAKNFGAKKPGMAYEEAPERQNSLDLGGNPDRFRD